MGGFLDRLDAMEINTMSPTRAVKARFNRNDGIHIDWAKQSWQDLSAEKLSSEISKAVIAALEGAEKGTELARKSVREAAGRASDRQDPKPEKAERRRLVNERISQLKITDSAVRELVTVEWRGRRDVTVRLAPKALNRLDPPALRDAVNQALAAARKQHGTAVAQAFADIYQFDKLAERGRNTR